MSRELLTEYPNLLLTKSIERAKEKPMTSLEEHISRLPLSLQEALIKEAQYIINHVLKPLLNSDNLEQEYIVYLTKYYVASRSLIFTVLLGYIERGEVPEFEKMFEDITKSYHDFIHDLQNLKNILTEDEIDILSFMFLSACEYNLGIAKRMTKLPMEIFSFLKIPELFQLISYANILDCILSSAIHVSLGDIKPNERVKENLKTLIEWGNNLSHEVFNLCIRVGISDGDNVIRLLPEVREKFLRELEESFEWWVRERLKMPYEAKRL
jgi:hypothetical protein